MKRSGILVRTPSRARRAPSVPRVTAWSAIVTIASAVFLAVVPVAGAAPIGPAVAVGAAGPAQGTAVVLSGSPGTLAVNPETNTLYVPIQCVESYCPNGTDGDTVDVVNDATCNAKVQSDCRVVAAPAGASPTAAAIDEQTDTVYFPGAAGTVTVLDGARCNATVTSGCGKDLATIQVGGSPVAAAADPLTNTLYVADSQSDDVSVVNIARCNALTTTGCGQPVKTVQDSNGPQALDVDVATDTVYTADAGSGDGDTVSVINGARCNGSDSSGCGSTPPTVTVGSGAWWVAVDQTSDTIYAANQ